MTTITTNPTHRRLPIAGLESTEGGCVLRLRSDGASAEESVRVVGHRPRVDLARRWAAQVRRVDRISIELDRDLAVASGFGRRLPFTRRIPMSLALGLASLGTPTVVWEDPT